MEYALTIPSWSAIVAADWAGMETSHGEEPFTAVEAGQQIDLVETDRMRNMPPSLADAMAACGYIAAA